MAAFSYQQHNSYLLDPTLLFPNPTNTTNGTTTNTAAAWFHQPHDHSFHGHHYNLVSVANKLQSSDSSMSMFLDNQKAVETGNALLAKNICKDKQIMSSLNQPQSKDTSNRMKKQKKKTTKKGSSEEGAVDYVHVRARRGQATDSHSLAERVRRGKISQRMKLLQSIVPGCDKVTGKALMLDEIINYIQSLQNQVEFLSMKLATLNSMLYDFGVDMDTLMLKPDENMSSMVLPSTQSFSPNGGATTIAPPATNDNFNHMPPLIYGSAATNSLLFQQPQMPSILSQGNGHQMWNVDEQKLKLDNRFAFSNNLSSFH